MEPITVFIADDHPIVRLGMRNYLDRTPEISVIGEAGTGPDTLIQVKMLMPDVLLLDLDLPGLSGYEVARQLLGENIPTRILVVSAYQDKQYLHELKNIGISGYLVKEDAVEFMIEAILGVARGKPDWYSPTLQFVLLDEPDEQGGMTPRELEVMALVAEGKTNRAISRLLGVTEKTVEKHLDNVFQKLGVFSRVEAAVRVIREGWV